MKKGFVGRIAIALIAAAALALYLLTAYPEPGWIDSGVLAACSRLLDIPHPTAKQLYILLSRVFVVLLPGTFWPLTFFSALSVTAAIWFVGSMTFAARTRVQLWAGAAASAVLATAPLVWEQATINEVHALQLLLFALFLRVWWTGQGPRHLTLLAYLAGLALANHGTAIFLLPFLVDAFWRERRALQGWIPALGFALLGLSLYLYFPIRSGAGALLDWGGTSHWGGFVRHVTGWQYAAWMGGENLAQLGQRAELFGWYLWDNLPWVLLPLCVYGVWTLWHCTRRLAIVTGAGFLLCTVVSSSYAIPDIGPYYLLDILLLVIWSGVGTARLLEQRRIVGYFALGCVGATLAVSFPQRLEQLDQRQFHVATDWIRDASDTVEPGSIVLTRSWDHYSPWFYLRHVEDFRPDVLWLDTRLIARSWYPAYIRKVAPERYSRAASAIDRLAPLVAKFEAGDPVNSTALDSAYGAALNALTLGQPGRVYVDAFVPKTLEWGDPLNYLHSARLAPRGLLIQVLRKGEQPNPLPAWPHYRNWDITGIVSEQTAAHLDLYDSAYAAWRRSR